MEITKEIKKLMAIHDLCGVGSCSLATVLPIMSAMNIECRPLPTALLSNHTGYDEFSFYDFTPHIKGYCDVWRKNNFKFDAVYTGFLGSSEQIDTVCDIFDSFDFDTIIVDPVMADNGVKYKTYTHEMCDKMALLVERANIIMPNITEATILTGDPYCGEDISKEAAKKMAKKLMDMGPECVVITGARKGQTINNMAFSGDDVFTAEIEAVDVKMHGTGDLFASIMSGYILNGYELPQALKKTSDIVRDIVDYTNSYGDIDVGPAFMPFISKL